jgi:CRP/FNR family transcriptional regulator, cyclic AMP receptor protein
MLRAMAAPIDLIKRVPLFADLDDRELREIADAMKERTWEAGESVTDEGSGGVGFFVIEEGTANVTVAGDERRTLVAGDYFGDVALVADVDRTATITAESDLRCYGMTSWEFRPLVQREASIAWKLLQTMGRRLAEAERRAG